MTNGTDHRAEWEGAFAWDDYLGSEVKEHRDLWLAVWQRAEVPPEVLARAAEIAGTWRLLVISEDWCGDASNTVPVIAKLALMAAPALELRVVKRDENLPLMDQYLTGPSRSIPLVVVLDDAFRPVGRWGPRPAALQDFVLREKESGRPLKELYREVRSWYARDRGRTTLDEILGIIAGAAAVRA